MSKIDPAMAVAMGALLGALQNTRVLCNHGLISPSEVDSIWEGIVGWLEKLPPEMGTSIISLYDGKIVELRKAAATNWQDKT